MEDCFETLISSYLDSKVGIVEHFVSEELAQHLVKRLFELKEQNLLKAAGIGNAAKLTQNSTGSFYLLFSWTSFVPGYLSEN